MKMLALADLHGDGEVLDRLGVLPIRRQNYDLYLIAGDITDGSLTYLDDLLNVVSPVYAVPGNCDSQEVLDRLEMSGASLHGRVREFQGVKLAGFGFSPPTPFSTPGELPESEILRRVREMPVDEKTLFLAHAPPKGILDEVEGVHVGSEALREMIEEKKPFLYLCGHVHEVTGTKRLGNTLVVQIPPAEELKAAEIVLNPRSLECQVEFVVL